MKKKEKADKLGRHSVTCPSCGHEFTVTGKWFMVPCPSCGEDCVV